MKRDLYLGVRVLLTTGVLGACLCSGFSQYIGAPGLPARQAVTLYARLTLQPPYAPLWAAPKRITADGVLEPAPFATPAGNILVLTSMAASAPGSGVQSYYVGVLHGQVFPAAGGPTNVIFNPTIWSGQPYQQSFGSGIAVSSQARLGLYWVSGSINSLDVWLYGYLVPDTASPAKVRLEAPAQSASQISTQGFQIAVDAVPASLLAISSSSNLQDWGSQVVTQAPLSGTFTFTDTSVSNAPKHFYRASY